MKRILLFIALVSVIACAFVISISAEAPEMYIEFGARFEGSDQYITVYTENAEGASTRSSHPRIDFNNEFYFDVDFTQPIDKTAITGIDFSVSKAHGSQKTYVDRFTVATEPWTNCQEVKWFASGCTEIPSKLFRNWTGLKAFDFGCVTTIGDNAFENTGFVELVIPEAVTKIINSSFYGCQALTSVKFEGDVTSLGGSIFQKCPNLASADIGNLTKTGTNMFKESGLVSVTIPKTMTSIGNSTFESCKSITSIVFEEGFKGTLGSSAFLGTTAVTSLTLVEGITEIPHQCFWSVGKTNGIDRVVLPDSVTTLAGRAFADSGIKELVINETSQLEKITGNAFEGMKKMQSIYLPDGVEIQSKDLFKYCHGLEAVYNFENTVMNTGDGENVFPGGIFYECTKLKEIKLPKNITAISGNSFRYYALEKIYIPSSVSSISVDFINNLPTSSVIFCCGFNANQLLALTNNGGTKIQERIDGGKVVAYSGLNAEYDKGVIVENANTCDVYFDSIHLEDTNPCVIMCTRCGMCEQDPNAVHDFEKSVYSYANGYGKDGTISTKCKTENCMYNAEPKKEAIPALIACCLGYSVPENGGGRMVVGFKANTDAINAYTENTGKTIEFGAFAIAQKNLTGDVLNADGSAASGAIKAEMSHVGSFELIISGFKTEAQKSAMLAMGAYVIATKDNEKTISYIQYGTPTENQAYEFISYNDIL